MLGNLQGGKLVKSWQIFDIRKSIQAHTHAFIGSFSNFGWGRTSTVCQRQFYRIDDIVR